MPAGCRLRCVCSKGVEDAGTEALLFCEINTVNQCLPVNFFKDRCHFLLGRERLPKQAVEDLARHITLFSPGGLCSLRKAIAAVRSKAISRDYSHVTSHTGPGLMSVQGRRLGIGLTCVLLLAGCITVPERTPDAVLLPADFSTSGTVPLPGRWWENFGDATLDRLVEQSLANNFSLQSVWARLDQAAAVERIARAELFPSLDAEASAGRSWAHNDRGTTGNNYTVGAMASYELDLWGRIDSSSKAAMLDRRASEAQLTAAGISLSAEVASSWYQLVEQYGQQALVANQLDTNSRVLELITLRFRRGKVGATDVLQQRQLVESNRGELANVESLIGVFEHRLAILLGTTPDSRAAAPQQQLISLPPLPETGIPAELVQRRPDLRQGLYQLQAADQRTAAAVAERFPRISLMANTDTSSSDVDELFDNWLSNLTGNLVAPLVDGGRRRAEVDRSRAVTEQSLNDYRQQLLEALGEVEDALLSEQQQRAFIESLDKQLALSKQVISRVRDSYLYGVVDYLRVLDVLITNQDLERNRLTAQRELIDDRIALCRALAGGWTLERPVMAGELPTTRITHVNPE